MEVSVGCVSRVVCVERVCMEVSVGCVCGGLVYVGSGVYGGECWVCLWRACVCWEWGVWR